jgi:hypothetical protein
MVICQPEFISAFPFDENNYQLELMVICQAESISTSLFFEELATLINGYLSS